MNRDLLEKLLIPRPPKVPEPVTAGLHHFMYGQDDRYTRFHLRVDPDGSGLLIANANAAARLSSSGIFIAKSILDGVDQKTVLREVGRRFLTGENERIKKDIRKVRDLLEKLGTAQDVYPIYNLDDPSLSPYDARLMAPLAADLPLDAPEKLRPILAKLWEIGIPHITILIPETPDPSPVVSIVDYAEKLGLICGISGRASDLVQGSLLEDTAAAGIDHVTVFYAAAHAALHDSLFGDGDHAAAAEVFTRTQALGVADVGHIPLLESTIDDLDETLGALLELQVPNAAFYAIASEGEPHGAIPAPAMRQVAAQVEEDAGSARVRYIWEPPVQRDPTKPLDIQVRRGPRTSGDLSVRIEADGAVYPARGPLKSAGNILEDSWRDIWQNNAFKIYRERVEAPTRCEVCPGLAICAADCPREPAGWSLA